MLIPALLAPVLSFLADPAPSAEDLGKRYRATLEYSEVLVERSWTSGPEDVWSLDSFRYRVGRDLDVACGPCTVVIGARGTDALWAALYPEGGEATIEGPDLESTTFERLFLRFHPQQIGKLFPKKTVVGQGPVERLLDSRSLFAWKINSAMQMNNTPLVPRPQTMLFDADLVGGRRALLFVDSKKKDVTYDPAFRMAPLPPPVPIAPAEALEAFDGAWQGFDETYAMFGIKDVDWDLQRDRWRPVAERLDTVERVGAAIACCLEPLMDGHVWVSAAGRSIAMSRRERHLNGTRRSLEALVGELELVSDDLGWCRKDDIGVLVVFGLGSPNLGGQVDTVLEVLGDTRGLLIDLRFNGGGSENLARALAGRFVAEPAVYSRNRYRAGAGRDELGPWLDRVVEPRGPWRYRAPVVVLQGPKTMSSAESLVWMLRQAPDVTTFGGPTAGSSANPTRLELADGQIAVNLPRWLDGGPEGEVFEDRGIAPDVPVECTPEHVHEGEDPVAEAALEHLTKAAKKSRRSGRPD